MINPHEFATRIFAAVDAMDLAQMRSHLAEDCCFRFGNQPELHGLAEIEAASTAFYDMLTSIRHRILNAWATDDGHVITKVIVSYQRRDGFELTCPAVAIWRVADGRIREYDVLVDNSRLFV